MADKEKRLRFDPAVCSGCLNCVMTCAQERIGMSGPAASRLRIVIDLFGGPHRVRVCRHCDPPQCVAACPNGAMIFKAETGTWDIDGETCVRCLSCVEACEYKALFVRPKEDEPLKCDLCQGEPKCVDACVFGALQAVREESGSGDG